MISPMLHDDKHEWISAYVDGEVSPSERRVVEQWMETDLELKRYYNELLELKSRLASLRHAGDDAQLGRDLSPSIFASIAEASSSAPSSGELTSRSHEGPQPRITTPGWSVAGFRLAAVAAAVTLMVWFGMPRGDRSVNSLMGSSEPNNSGLPGGGVDAPDPALTPVDPPSPEMFVNRRPASFILVEVELSPEGLARDSVNVALERAGVGPANGIPVQHELESALLKSRFFFPQNNALGADGSSAQGKKAKGNQAEGKKEGAKKSQPQLAEMVYCVLNGPQLDSIWNRLAAERQGAAVTNMKIDVVFLDNDVNLFQLLHQSAEVQIASATPSGRPTLDELGKPTLRLRAQRLLLTAALQTKLGGGLRVLSAAPAVGLLGLGVIASQSDEADEADEAVETESPEVVPNEKQLWMASQTTGVLFVVRTKAN